MKSIWLDRKVKGDIGTINYFIGDTKIDVSEGSELGDGILVDGALEVGRYSYLRQNCEINSNVKIGDFCSIANSVIFEGNNHDVSKLTQSPKVPVNNIGSEQDKGEIKVGNDVWIGRNSIILADVEIGDGAVIGAGAVVTKDVAPYEIVGGVPAERIGYRFDERTRRKLIELKWWKWDKSRLSENAELLKLDLSNKTPEQIDDIII